MFPISFGYTIGKILGILDAHEEIIHIDDSTMALGNSMITPRVEGSRRSLELLPGSGVRHDVQPALI